MFWQQVFVTQVLAKIFSQSIFCALYLTVSFEEQMFFNFNEVQLSGVFLWFVSLCPT